MLRTDEVDELVPGVALCLANECDEVVGIEAELRVVVSVVRRGSGDVLSEPAADRRQLTDDEPLEGVLGVGGGGQRVSRARLRLVCRGSR